MIPRPATDPALCSAILALGRAEFAAKTDRIAPPSPRDMMTVTDLTARIAPGEIRGIGDPVVACVFLTPKPHALYIGKLATAGSHRRQGFARALIATAETRARAPGLPSLELQTCVGLIASHISFRALGFSKVARAARPGDTRPTSITFRRPVRHRSDFP